VDTLINNAFQKKDYDFLNTQIKNARKCVNRIPDKIMRCMEVRRQFQRKDEKACQHLQTCGINLDEQTELCIPSNTTTVTTTTIPLECETSDAVQSELDAVAADPIVQNFKKLTRALLRAKERAPCIKHPQMKEACDLFSNKLTTRFRPQCDEEDIEAFRILIKEMRSLDCTLSRENKGLISRTQERSQALLQAVQELQTSPYDGQVESTHLSMAEHCKAALSICKSDEAGFRECSLCTRVAESCPGMMESCVKNTAEPILSNVRSYLQEAESKGDTSSVVDGFKALGKTMDQVFHPP